MDSDTFFLSEISSYNAFVKRYFRRRNLGNQRIIMKMIRGD